jgi:arylsulfatase A-like enzyme
MTDQQRFDAMSCAGNPKIRTPHLDALAASGIRFSQAVTPTPVCVAARMSFITGQRVSRTGYVSNSSLPGYRLELPTLMGSLQEAGYWTQGIGKMHFRGRHYGLRDLMTMEECISDRVDDDYLCYLRDQSVRTRFPKGVRDLLMMQPQTCSIPTEHHMNTWVADRSVDFLREHTHHRKTPFFLWSSWISPHPPFAPCEPYDTMYDPSNMALPPYTDRPIGSLPPGLHAQRARLDGAHRDPDRLRRLRALYYGLVSHVDDGVGSIMAELDNLGIADNTVILFVSDHGEMLGDHGLGQKFSAYEHSVRIPFLLRWPGKTKPGTVSDDLVSLLDFYPTLLDELGLPYPEQLEPLPGANLVGKEGGGLRNKRKRFVIDFGAGETRWISVRTKSEKYAYYAKGGVEECYDLLSDPWEESNLADRSPSWAKALKDQALDWEQQFGTPDSPDSPDSLVNQAFRSYPVSPVPDETDCRHVTLNEGTWPNRLPAGEIESVESFPEAFTRAISKESLLSPDKLSIDLYKSQIEQTDKRNRGTDSLVRTPWEDTYRNA